MLGSSRPPVTLTSRAEAQTANGCVWHKFYFGRVGLRNRKTRLSHVLSSGIFARIVRDWIYIMFCEYGLYCMFRSEWLKDAKFKSLVANDRTDWCLKDRKAETESARLSHLEHSHCLWHWQWHWQWICSKEFFLDEWKPVYGHDHCCRFI